MPVYYIAFNSAPNIPQCSPVFYKALRPPPPIVPQPPAVSLRAPSPHTAFHSVLTKESILKIPSSTRDVVSNSSSNPLQDCHPHFSDTQLIQSFLFLQPYPRLPAHL